MHYLQMEVLECALVTSRIWILETREISLFFQSPFQSFLKLRD